MAIFSARERLSRLVELAGKEGIEARRELASELTDLLLNWPSIYPQGMREPFEALLEKAVRDVGPDTRATLANRFVAAPDTPLSILNLLVFDASPETRTAILLRNSICEPTVRLSRIPVDEATLLAAVRVASSDMAAILAPRLGIAVDIADQILTENSGVTLAVLCKGAKLQRQTFSALTVLAHPQATAWESYRRMAAYDAVPQDAAEALLSFWRGQAGQLRPEAEAA